MNQAPGECRERQLLGGTPGPHLCLGRLLALGIEPLEARYGWNTAQFEHALAHPTSTLRAQPRIEFLDTLEQLERKGGTGQINTKVSFKM